MHRKPALILGIAALALHLLTGSPGRAAEFRHVTLPMLGPTFLLVTLLTTIGSFQLFAEPYVMTGGGPSRSTLSVVLLMYEQGFRWWNMGYAAAVAFVLFALVLTVSLVELRWRPFRPEAPGDARADREEAKAA